MKAGAPLIVAVAWQRHFWQAFSRSSGFHPRATPVVITSISPFLPARNSPAKISWKSWERKRKKNPRTLHPGADYQPLSFSPQAKIKPTPAVFCGFGIKTDGYNSFEGLDVKGRWVIMFRGSPKGKKKLQRFGPLVDKARNAKKLGALGIIFIKGPNPSVGLEVVPPSKNVGASGEIMPAISISDKLASMLLTGSEDNSDFEKLFTKYHAMESTAGFALSSKISAEIGLGKGQRTGAQRNRLPASW